MPAVGPGVSQVLFSSDPPRARGCGVMQLDQLWGQLRLWPGPAPGCVAHESTGAEGRLISTMGALLVHSNVLQALSLRSRLWGCKSVVCMRRGFSSFSLAQPSGLSDDFSPTSACGPPRWHLLPRLPWMASQGCPHPSRQEGMDGMTNMGACAQPSSSKSPS